MPHKRHGKMYTDEYTCPHCGYVDKIHRYAMSAGNKTRTTCYKCRKSFSGVAGTTDVMDGTPVKIKVCDFCTTPFSALSDRAGYCVECDEGRKAGMVQHEMKKAIAACERAQTKLISALASQFRVLVGGSSWMRCPKISSVEVGDNFVLIRYTYEDADTKAKKCCTHTWKKSELYSENAVEVTPKG